MGDEKRNIVEPEKNKGSSPRIRLKGKIKGICAKAKYIFGRKIGDYREKWQTVPICLPSSSRRHQCCPPRYNSTPLKRRAPV
jgi:hypothetical protein